MGARLGSYVALLRGINVGGKNRLPMRDLAARVEDVGGTDVRTYIQSGNVAFRASRAAARRFCAALARAIGAEHGLEVPVVLRTADELHAVFDANPFAAADADPKSLHVAFLADEPGADAVASLDPQRSPGDSFAVRGREVYLHLLGGVAKTKLSNAWLDAQLGTVSTVRNWRTVGKLLELVDSLTA